MSKPTNKQFEKSMSDPLILKLFTLREEAGNRDLWITYKMIDAVITRLGWELAKKLAKSI